MIRTEATEPLCVSMRFFTRWSGPHADAWRFRSARRAAERIAGTLRASKMVGEENMMRKRMSGDTGLEVPVITLGGNVFGWTVGEIEAFELLDHAVELG